MKSINLRTYKREGCCQSVILNEMKCSEKSNVFLSINEILPSSEGKKQKLFGL